MEQEQYAGRAIEASLLPIVAATYSETSSEVYRLFGTAFLISDTGLTLTAYHVISNGARVCQQRGWTLSLIGKDHSGMAVTSVATPIRMVIKGDEGSDVCVIGSEYKAPAQYTVSRKKPGLWQRVATAGYPEETVFGEVPEIWLPLRGQKGIIQREIPSGPLLHLSSSTTYELSFTVASGMSGAPLFTYPGEKIEVVGILNGTYESEYQISEMKDVRDDGSIYQETRLSLNRYGIAVSIHHILSAPLHIEGGVTTVEKYLEARGEII